MGIYDRNYYRDEQGGGSFLWMSSGTHSRSMVLVLLGINVAIFILDAFSPRIPNSTVGELCGFLSLHDGDVAKPWYWFRFLTAAFAHASPQHIFGNMIVLFFFGRPIEALYGSKKFLWMYLTAAISANIVWSIVEIANPSPSVLLGASGATTAVFILFCIHFPQQKIFLLFFPFFGIPAWIMGVVIIGGDILGQLGVGKNEVSVAFLVHLVGAAYAYVFFRTRWTMDQLLPLGGGGGSLGNVLKPKLKVHRPDPSPQEDQLEAQADKILKKLHEKGEASLTRRERRILEEYSRRIKQRK